MVVVARDLVRYAETAPSDVEIHPEKSSTLKVGPIVGIGAGCLIFVLAAACGIAIYMRRRRERREKRPEDDAISLESGRGRS